VKQKEPRWEVVYGGGDVVWSIYNKWLALNKTESVVKKGKKGPREVRLGDTIRKRGVQGLESATELDQLRNERICGFGVTKKKNTKSKG